MTTYWFELGTTLAYGTSTNPASAGKGDKPVTVTAGIGNLEPATAYHVRLVASNDRGVTAGGRDLHDAGHPREPAARAAARSRRPVAAARDRARARARRRAGPRAQRDPRARRAARSSCACPGRPTRRRSATAPRSPVGSIIDTRAGTVKLQSALPGEHPDRHLPRRPLRGAPARRRPRHDRARAARRAPHAARAAAPAPPRPAAGARRARCGATTATATSARARATASSPCAARPGSSRTAATGRSRA